MNDSQNYHYLRKKNMHLLIADSGATKTSWAIPTESGTSIIQTSGMNPSLKEDYELESVVSNELIPQLSFNDFENVYFYGAGCKDRKNSERVKKILQETFRSSEPEVKTDIEGAGIALFGDGEGIVVISGTGSSAGFMRGGRLQDSMTSKAYPDGDMGSGCHIGSLVLQDYFESKAPVEIQGIIDANRNLNFDELKLAFQNPKHSKKLSAKVMRNIAKLKEHEYLKDVVKVSVNMLVEQLQDYFGSRLNEYPVKLNGKTASHFEDEFREVFQESGIEIAEINVNPIQGLIIFHTKNND